MVYKIPLPVDENCMCGSGKSYRFCHWKIHKRNGHSFHKYMPEPLSSRKIIDRSTLEFIEFLKNVIGIRYDSKTGLASVSKDISPKRIHHIYSILPTMFPHLPNFQEVYSELSENDFVGLYWGNPDVNSISRCLTRYVLYTKTIAVTNPFCDMMRYHMDRSPLSYPEEWIQITVNQALFLVSLEGWIREGVVTIVPPIKWFDFDYFRRKIAPISEARLSKFSEGEMKDASFNFFRELVTSLSPEHLEIYLKQNNVPDDLKETALEVSREHLKRNPLRYAFSGGQSGIIKSGSGNSLESILLSSQLAGGYLLFGERQYREEYDRARGKIAESNKLLSEVSRAYADVKFSFLNDVPLDFALNQRKDGNLEKFRSYLIKLWSDISNTPGLSEEKQILKFYDDLKVAYGDYKKEWEAIDKKLFKQFGKAALVGGVAVLSGQIGLTLAGTGLVGFGLEQLYESYETRRKHKNNPLGVFLDLDMGGGAHKS